MYFSGALHPEKKEVFERRVRIILDDKVLHTEIMKTESVNAVASRRFLLTKSIRLHPVLVPKSFVIGKESNDFVLLTRFLSL